MPATAGAPPRSIPFFQRDPKSYAAQKRLVTAGQAGQRQGVSVIPSLQLPAVGASGLQAAQKLTGFPVMDLQRQATLFGSDQVVEPPDTQLAAGPANLVEATNDTLSVWTKSGSLLSTYDLNHFFPVPASFVFSDPRILYDAESGRWFLSGVAIDLANFDSELLIGVSATSDPTGAWNKYPLAMASGVGHDQPSTGVNSDKVVISWNDFTGSSVSTAVFSGAVTWVLQKSDLLAGAAVPRHQAFAPDLQRFRIVPVQSLTPTSTEWLAYNNADCANLVCNQTSPTVGVIAITGTPAGS